MLTAIARALRFDDAEREHLFNLARAAGPARRTKAERPSPDTVRPELQYLLDAITTAPALIANPYMDIVAANALGYALHSLLFSSPSGPPTSRASCSSTPEPTTSTRTGSWPPR